MSAYLQHQVVVRLSAPLLLQMLFPEGTQLLDIALDRRLGGQNDVLIKVSHPDLPALQEGQDVPECTPLYRLSAPDDQNLRQVMFESWQVELSHDPGR